MVHALEDKPKVYICPGLIVNGQLSLSLLRLRLHRNEVLGLLRVAVPIRRFERDTPAVVVWSNLYRDLGMLAYDRHVHTP